MELWIAAIICLVGFGSVAALIWLYCRDKKKRFLVFGVTVALLLLAAITYVMLTLILVGGIN